MAASSRLARSRGVIATPCRRCGQIIKIPISPDALCGVLPHYHRPRRNPAYDPPRFDAVASHPDATAGYCDFPVNDQKGALAERNIDRLEDTTMPFHPPPELRRRADIEVDTFRPIMVDQEPVRSMGILPPLVTRYPSSSATQHSTSLPRDTYPPRPIDTSQSWVQKLIVELGHAEQLRRIRPMGALSLADDTPLRGSPSRPDPEIDPPRRRSSAGSISVGHFHQAGDTESDLRRCAFAGVKAQKPDYGNGHTFRGGTSAKER